MPSRSLRCSCSNASSCARGGRLPLLQRPSRLRASSGASCSSREASIGLQPAASGCAGDRPHCAVRARFRPLGCAQHRQCILIQWRVDATQLAESAVPAAGCPNASPAARAGQSAARPGGSRGRDGNYRSPHAAPATGVAATTRRSTGVGSVAPTHLAFFQHAQRRVCSGRVVHQFHPGTACRRLRPRPGQRGRHDVRR